MSTVSCLGIGNLQVQIGIPRAYSVWGNNLSLFCDGGMGFHSQSNNRVVFVLSAQTQKELQQIQQSVLETLPHLASIKDLDEDLSPKKNDLISCYRITPSVLKIEKIQSQAALSENGVEIFYDFTQTRSLNPNKTDCWDNLSTNKIIIEEEFQLNADQKKLLEALMQLANSFPEKTNLNMETCLNYFRGLSKAHEAFVNLWRINYGVRLTSPPKIFIEGITNTEWITSNP